MGEAIRAYTDLVAWQRCYQLGLKLHAMCVKLPEHERFALTAMLRRTALSVAPEIADAYGRGSTLEYVRGLKNARGMIYKLDTMLLMCRDLNYLSDNDHPPLKAALDEAERILAGLIRSLER